MLTLWIKSRTKKSERELMPKEVKIDIAQLSLQEREQIAMQYFREYEAKVLESRRNTVKTDDPTEVGQRGQSQESN